VAGLFLSGAFSVAFLLQKNPQLLDNCGLFKIHLLEILYSPPPQFFGSQMERMQRAIHITRWALPCWAIHLVVS
jgi:hypothetical protein